MFRLRFHLLAMAMLAAAVIVMAGPARAAEPSGSTASEDAIVKGSIVVKGEGAAPSDRPLSQGQRRILALRAAKVIAAREAVEILNGMAVSGETTVLNSAARSDEVFITVQGLIRGAQVTKEAYDPASGVGAVLLNVPLTGPNGVYARLLPKVVPTLPFDDAGAYRPPEGAVPPAAAYDGLIVDVRNEPFKPALINRVVAENGEVIYDPTKVARNILIERGAAEYTNDIGKARALLGERGSVNPMVVKAGGVVKGTDAVVSPDDAGAIFTSNQKNNFLEGAFVVFVLR